MSTCFVIMERGERAPLESDDAKAGVEARGSASGLDKSTHDATGAFGELSPATAADKGNSFASGSWAPACNKMASASHCSNVRDT